MNQSMAVAGSRRFLPVLLLLFVGSGCAALIYEIVWFQLLQLVIGLTNVSLGVLLGTYMGGMCLGSLLLPRLISQGRHPLRVYALLELGIGAIGIAILFVVPWISQIYTASAGRGLSGFLLRGTVAGVCLLPPTVLMGATLPAIARWVETTPEGVSWLGFFYGGNIAGAVFGCLLAGFYLLRVHDMATATCTAAAINLGVALAALTLAARTAHVAAANGPPDRAASLETPQGQRSEHTAPFQPSQAGTRAVCVVIALSGLSALGAEVVWTRLLSLMLGGTVYTFSIILAVFLAGLGLGSGAGAYLSRSTVRPGIALGCCQLFLVGAVAWTACMIAQSLPYWPINPGLCRNPWLGFQLDLARCLWAVLPATILWGASFPLALAAVLSPGEDAGRLVGKVYAANTVGAIAGALAFSLLVIPWLGTQWAQRLLLGVSAASGLLILAPLLRPFQASSADSRGGLGRLAGACLLVLATGLTVLLAWRVSPAPWGLTAYGRFMATYASQMAPGIRPEKEVPSTGGRPDIFCTYLGEGLNGSVAVTLKKSGERSFHSAGKVQASNEPQDMRLQRMLGHLAALAHPQPQSVLVVACGAGVTAGSFVVHPEVKRIVICDIEPLVPKFVAPMFEKENYGVVHDPRTEVVFDDGRHFVRTTKEKFDVITSDPIDPWVKGCAALNTVEYYQMCKAHLNPGGVMALWMPLYESKVETTKSLIATFFKVFPNGSLWSNDTDGEGYDAVLLGQLGPAQFDLQKLQARLDRKDHARLKESLARVGFHSVVELLGTYAGQATDLQGWMRDAQINTDRNLRLQYLAGLWLNSYVGSEILADISRHYRFPDNLFVGSEQIKQALKARHLDHGAKLSGPTPKTGTSLHRASPRGPLPGATSASLGIGPEQCRCPGCLRRTRPPPAGPGERQAHAPAIQRRLGQVC
ncbi:MAG: fused MFS/spermidine synthase [Verrucomicrobiota bacterium]|jgi:spermidine synthase